MSASLRPVLAAPPDPDDPHRPVRSPCVSVCRIDPASGWCEGCQRTLDEIADWGTMPDAERLAVWSRIRARRGLAAP